MRRPIILFALLLAALLAGLAATKLMIQPPGVRASSEPGQFDARRAKARLAIILGDERPHPADSAGNDAVRERLVGQIRATGLNPIVRDQFACNTIYKQRGVTCARVRNVIVALGPPAGKAVLLNAHYDSTPVGPAAGDDGVGVSTLLEVASILKNERLSRPVILLFNEGEELGLVGARAFMADPLSGRVDSLINLEARGVRGPVTMFETSLPNGPPVRAFARAVARPFANSLATDFYRQLPNYTDVNSFEERGWTTLNFAMIGNETRYHSPGDDLAALDPRSLQHMGDQTLAVARELANAQRAGGGTFLFTDIAGLHLFVIPALVGFALLGLLVVAFVVLSVGSGGTLRGVATVVAGLIVAGAVAWLALYLMGLGRTGSFWRAYPVWTQLAVYACGLVGAVSALALIARKLTIEQLRAAYWLAYLLLGVAVFFVAPGGVVYFLLPPLVALVGIILKQERIGAIIAAVLLWLTLGEVIALLGELMNNGPFFVFAPLATLVAMPWLIEAKPLVDRSGRAGAIAASAALMLAGWAAVAAAPAYSADRQQRFVIQHVTDAGTGRAWWAIGNDQARLPDRYGGIHTWRRDEIPYLEAKRWMAAAPVLAAAKPPRLELLSRGARGRERTVAFRLEPNGAESVTLVAEKDSGIVAAGTRGYVRPISPEAEGKYYFSCFGRSCAGATLQLTTKSQRPLALTIVGSTRGLPPAAKPLIAQRPRFARPQYTADSTLTLSRMAL